MELGSHQRHVVNLLENQSSRLTNPLEHRHQYPQLSPISLERVIDWILCARRVAKQWITPYFITRHLVLYLFFISSFITF